MKLLYFTDPMCSWCYGFGPTAEKLEAHYRGQIEFETVPGGLRPFSTRPMTKILAQEVSHHWHQVAATSGQPFSFTFFDDHPEFVYDTAPACRAVVVADQIDRSLTLRYLHALQARFYAQGHDPTVLETFTASAADVGLDPELFSRHFLDPESLEKTKKRFECARSSGVMGYPTLKLQLDDRLRLVAGGYTSYSQIVDVVTAVINRYGS